MKEQGVRSIELRAAPHNDDVEFGVLGCVLLDNRTLHKVTRTLGDQDFYRQNARATFRAMRALHMMEMQITPLTLADYLSTTRDFALFGRDMTSAIKFFSSLPRYGVVPAILDDSLRIVRDLARVRRLQTLTYQIHEEAFSATRGDLEGWLADKSAALAEALRTRDDDDSTVSYGDAIDAFVDEYTDLERGQGSGDGMRCGIEEIDRLVGGFHQGRSIVLAGLSKQGKSKLAQQIGDGLALSDSAPAVEWYSVEMPAKDMARRAVSREGGIYETILQRPQRYNAANDTTHQRRFAAALDRLEPIRNTVRVHYQARPRLADIILNTEQRLADLEAEASRLSLEERRPLVIIVDYLQRVDAGFSGSSAEYNNVSEASKALTGLAIEKNVCVICVAHFNREAAKTGSIPSPSQMRGSGAIEQDFAVSLVYHRPFWDRKGDDDESKRLRRFAIVWQSLSRYEEPGVVFLDAGLGHNTFTPWIGDVPEFEHPD